MWLFSVWAGENSKNTCGLVYSFRPEIDPCSTPFHMPPKMCGCKRENVIYHLNFSSAIWCQILEDTETSICSTRKKYLEEAPYVLLSTQTLQRHVELPRSLKELKSSHLNLKVILQMELGCVHTRAWGITVFWLQEETVPICTLPSSPTPVKKYRNVFITRLKPASI